jgi:hypothetical protein
VSYIVVVRSEGATPNNKGEKMVTYHCRDCGSMNISLCNLNPNEDYQKVEDLNDFISLIYCSDCGEENKSWNEMEVK